MAFCLFAGICQQLVARLLIVNSLVKFKRIDAVQKAQKCTISKGQIIFPGNDITLLH